MKSIWANALLSDGEILFWYTGDKCNDWYDFYKDFYYARINSTEYEKSHKLELVCKELDGADNNKAFEVDAPNFYRQYEIGSDSRGRKPYGDREPFAPPYLPQPPKED